MRKVKLVALSMLLCMTMGLTVHAEGESNPSVSAGGKIVSITEGTKFVNASEEEISQDEVSIKIEAGSDRVEDEKVIMEALQVENMDNVGQFACDVTLEANGANVQPQGGGVYIRIPVQFVKAGDKAAVFHLKDGAWEQIANVTAEDGAIVAGPFTSFSPVYVVTAPADTTGNETGSGGGNGSDTGNNGGTSEENTSNNNTADNNAANNNVSNNDNVGKVTSPKTGDSYMIYVAEAVAMTAMVGLLVIGKKGRV